MLLSRFYQTIVLLLLFLSCFANISNFQQKYEKFHREPDLKMMKSYEP